MVYRFKVRVYYEDTDSGGVVYHSNYLKYMERARTEALRSIGIEQSRLRLDHDVVFAVSALQVYYRHPAKLDDLLEVRTELREMRGARLQFRQCIYAQERLLVEADVSIASISAAGKVRRIPEPVRLHLHKELV